MTDLELRQKIEQKLAELPFEQLSLVSDFLDSLLVQKTMKRPLRRLSPIRRGKKADELLKLAGTWQGDDLEDCLQFVRETRSQSEF